MLLKEGCSTPVNLSVCFNFEHPNRWSLLKGDDACDICGEKGTVPYYYLSIIDKIKTWCSDETTCDRMLAHWKDRDTWLRGGASVLREVWHGSRFKELSWFWDPSSKLVCNVQL